MTGSPVGSTLSIVLAVIAVVAGFLILRAITDDDDDGGAITPAEHRRRRTTDARRGIDVGRRSPSGRADDDGPAAPVKPGATVVVANASGIGGSAGAMTTALQTAGYTLRRGRRTAPAGQLDTSVVYYVAGDPPPRRSPRRSWPPTWAGSAVPDAGPAAGRRRASATPTVLVMLGTDTAGKTLADLNPATVTAPPAAGGTTTTDGVGG